MFYYEVMTKYACMGFSDWPSLIPESVCNPLTPLTLCIKGIANPFRYSSPQAFPRGKSPLSCRPGLQSESLEASENLPLRYGVYQWEFFPVLIEVTRNEVVEHRPGDGLAPDRSWSWAREVVELSSAIAWTRHCCFVTGVRLQLAH